MTLPSSLTTALREALSPRRLRRDVSLAPFTTFKLGGTADWYADVRSADELATVTRAARAHDVPYFLLGTGANVIVGDHGYQGLVIHNRARGLQVDHDTNRIRAESGTLVYPDLIERAVSAGLSGLEHYVGIPSTVGGALWQNLHFLSPPPDRERTVFWDEVVHSAELLTEEGDRKTVGPGYFDFGYDYSILHDRDDVVLATTSQLEPGDPTRMREIMDANLQWRAERHPPLDTEPSVGSIFKKIEGVGAGRLIDECGLKGARIGGAMITHRHANIFVNVEDARAADVCALIELARDTVARETGHRLETEIDFVGEFAPPTDAEPTFVPKDPDLVTAADRAKAS
ncbi:UDP-N-acetylmuramate dehydrogenase [Salinibacter altiplanensis]|uniref:UDP-N-acetylmuramate dehydrogenase n=1 Tax=Salinibacter altiplanensis TaxID=1803181 RepID=UPI001F3EB0CF|nr:UDP-N-acetylmuramate dehydrogenase [Salinibacter altiplanensis]